MESAAAATGSEAVCPQHPERTAVGACARCGTFVCETCAVSRDPPLCETCYARRGLPLLSKPFDLGTAFAGAWELFTLRIGLVSAACAVWAIPAGLIEHLLDRMHLSNVALDLASRLATGLLTVFAELACLALMVAAAEEKPAGLGWGLAEGFRAFPRVFVARLVAGIQVFLWSLLLLVPGWIKAVRLWPVTVIAYREENAEVCERAEGMVSGRSWPVFGLIVVVGLLSFVPVVGLGVVLQLLAGGVPLLAVPARIAGSFLSMMMVAFVMAAQLAAYYTLRNAQAPLD